MLKPIAALGRSRGNPPLPAVLLLAVGVILVGVVAGDLLWRPGAEAQSTSPLTLQPQTSRVGINITAPAYTLDVAGPVNATNLYTSGNVGIGTTVPGDKLDVAGNLRISAGYHLVYNGTSGVIDWGAGGLGNLYFRTLATQGDIFTYSDRMIILNNGNVGIGTTTPGALLDLWGSTSGTNQKTLQIDGNISFNILGSNPPGVNKGLYWHSAGATGGNPAYSYIYREQATGKLYLGSQGAGTILETVNNGNVGIGTSAPTHNLAVLQKTDSQNADGLAVYRASGTSKGIFLQGADNNTYMFNFGGGLQFWVNGGTQAMTVDSTGKVGIGTAAPSATFDVVGTVSASVKAFRIPHPLDPAGKDLTHASLEGPEIAVYYRGEAQLALGEAVVTLPPYFEALTLPTDRTVQVSPVGGWSPLYIVSGVQGGQFTVRVATGGNPSQRFYWEVKAVRRDVPPLTLEAAKRVEPPSPLILPRAPAGR